MPTEKRKLENKSKTDLFLELCLMALLEEELGNVMLIKSSVI